jgi:hypothetical protein
MHTKDSVQNVEDYQQEVSVSWTALSTMAELPRAGTE